MGDEMKKWLFLVTILPCLGVQGVYAQDDDFIQDTEYDESEEEDFEGFYGDEDFVSLSTGTKKSLAKVPSVASIITAKQIKEMGARSLTEVLDRLPGIHAATSSEIYGPKYIIRGITSNFNPQTLVLVNGVPITSVFRGDRHAAWGTFPVHSIARIEVIRGPGSALHGADAFAGVINIITKGFDDIKESEIGFRGGSFGTMEAWLQTSYEIDKLKMAFSLEVLDSDGHDGKIAVDAQSALDSLVPVAPAVSLAPGSVNVGYRGYDFRTELRYEEWMLKFGYQNRENMGTGQGVAKALDPEGKFGSDKAQVILEHHKEWNDNWVTDVRYSNYRSTQQVEQSLILFPRGAFWGAFPDGFIGNPQTWEKTQVIQAKATYRGFDKHLFTVGGGYRDEDLYRVRETKNFQNGIEPLPNLIDVSDTSAVFLPESRRHSKFAFIQDEYQLAPDWELTAGVRFDNYSDFGTTINPRLALVWATSHNLSTKFLYGRAFRAPAFVETKVVNNPVNLGNPNLDPETIDTYEVSFNYQLSADTHVDLNLYYLVMDDYIDFFPDAGAPTITAQNGSEYNGTGIETEVTFKMTDDVTLMFNYAYQQLVNDSSDNDLGNAPTNQFYGQVNWHINDPSSLNARLTYVGSTQRNQFDARRDLESYTKFSLTYNYKGLFDNVDLQIVADNLFDEDIREPSRGPSVQDGAVDIPGDLPQASRSFYIGLSTQF